MQFLWFLFWRGSFVQQRAFLISYKKAPAPFQQFIHFLDFFATLLVLFPLLLDEQFHYFFPEHFCSASRGTSNHHGTKPCRESGELSLRFYLGHLHQLGVYLARSWAWCQDCVFCPAAEFGENDFIALHVQAAIHSVAPFQLASLSTPSLVGLPTIPCTLPLYFA